MSDFAPLDSRSRVLHEYTFPLDRRPEKRSRGLKAAAVSDLAKTLVTDSYGPSDNLKRVCWDAYNKRQVFQGVS